MIFNRYASREFRRDPNSSLGKPLFLQMVEQFEADSSRLPKFNKTGVPWHVDLRLEGATDAGGPARDCFTDVCTEMMHPSVGLFVPCPNMVANRGAVRDLLVPNPEPAPPGSLREKMFFYAGLVLSVCYISRLQTTFRFARFVWAALAGALPTIDDIYEIDDEFQFVMASIQEPEGKAIDEAQWQASYHYNFAIKDSIGRLVELFPGGAAVPVTFERRIEFVERAQKYRLKEFTAHLDALRRGFQTFFAPQVAAMFAPWELALICGGPNDCPVEELKRLCKVDPPSDAERLWRILALLTPQERVLFIKFGTGRGGLPPPGLDWQDKLEVIFKSSSSPDRQRGLPTAQTCYSKISMPRYDSDEVYLQKLRIALTLGVGIEDHTPEWREVRSFLG
jgi:hypothetical protein